MERESGTLSLFLSLGALVGVQLVQAQDTPRLPCQLLSQGAGVLREGRACSLPGGGISAVSCPFPPFPLALFH